MQSDEPLLRWHVARTVFNMAGQNENSELHNIVVVPQTNEINKSISQMYHQLGANHHPKLAGSLFGHSPVSVDTSTKQVRPPSAVQNFSQLYGAALQHQTYTTVLGIVIDRWELEYANRMFDNWANAVWVIPQTQEYPEEPLICLENSTSTNVRIKNLDQEYIKRNKELQEKLLLGSQIDGIAQADTTRKVDGSHANFLTEIYGPLKDILKLPSIDDAYERVYEISNGTGRPVPPRKAQSEFLSDVTFEADVNEINTNTEQTISDLFGEADSIFGDTSNETSVDDIFQFGTGDMNDKNKISSTFDSNDNNNISGTNFNWT
eukprot:UN27652